MAFNRILLIIIVLAFYTAQTKAQTIYYPAQSSQLLKATAADMALLMEKAINGSRFTTATYNVMPATGIVLIYDQSVAGNQACKTESDGLGLLTFRAQQDNGLVFGVYQYLQQNGFRFYQPGSIWEIIPALSSAYKKTDTTFTGAFKYKSWFISGGCNRWVMDNDSNYGWDTYFGKNGHNWALYQRRNGMTGAYHFTGHRGDIMSGSVLDIMKNNPCYVACYNGNRLANAHSVPDINNNSSMALWSNSIEQEYSKFKNTIFGNPVLYANYFHNFNYRYSHIGIEVPDGAQWGNSKDNGICSTVDYPKESDQHFILANHTAQNLNTRYPDKQLQLYAYSSHADVPSSNIAISNKIDVQVVPTAFQNESSSKGLLNRWYNTSGSVSEYHYLNITQWGGETPMFHLNELKSTLQRVKEKNSQGIIWEASPAKFASLPFLLAANSNLKDNIDVDISLQNFCINMFGSSHNTIYTLLQLWSDDKTISLGSYMPDNKYKIPLYLQLLRNADKLSQQDAPIVKDRIRELKAYLHYLVLYYDWIFDQRPHQAKSSKAAALCIYLAKVNKLQLVNSYFLISNIVSNYAVTNNFYSQYNISNGTAYQNGNLPLITASEIENNFILDIAALADLVPQYKMVSPAQIKNQFKRENVVPLDTINVKLTYTNGANYANRIEFYINVPAAGNFKIDYKPQFNMPGKGYLNFTVEATEAALGVVKDFSINSKDGAGNLTIALPAAGTYKLSVVSKYQTKVDLVIHSMGNYFYKNGPFMGNATENYNNDIQSLPGYFYVPEGLSKIYFSVNNSNPGGKGFATPNDISKAFVIKDNNGSVLQPRLVIPNDSSLFYLDVPYGGSGRFWQVQKTEQYRLCFANISNVQWYARRINTCIDAGFTISVINKNGNCITRLNAAAKTGNFKWEIEDKGQNRYYQNQSIVQLPENISADAVVTLTNGEGCSQSKRLGDDTKYLLAKKACTNGILLNENERAPILFPNPSTGIFHVQQNDVTVTAAEIRIFDARGVNFTNIKEARLFNISNAPAGVYWYKIKVNNREFSGKIMKF